HGVRGGPRRQKMLVYSTLHRRGNVFMTSETPATLEAALAELAVIVSKMEGGQLPLKESLAAYQRGAFLLAFCQNALKDAQQQVQVLERGVLKCFGPAGARPAWGRPPP